MKAEEIDPDSEVDEFVERIKDCRRKSDSEAHFRDDVNSVLDDYIGDLDIETTKEVERTTISGGRKDTAYGDLIIEYKAPNKFKERQEIEEAILGREGSDVGGLRQYMLDSARKETSTELSTAKALSRKVGVGFDGYRIFFYKFRPGMTVNPVLSQERTLFDYESEGVKGEFDNPNDIEVYTLEEGAIRFLTHLRSLSRKALKPDELTRSFGPEGPIAISSIKLLYKKLQYALEDGDPKVETLYEEWERVFGIIYGENADNIKNKEIGFGNIYEIEDDVEIKPFLFAVQTYYALFSKLLVLDLFSMFERSLTRSYDLLVDDDDMVKKRLDRVERGEEFKNAGLNRFFEQNHFSWYLSVWDEELASCVRDVATELEEFEPSTPTIRPDLAKDLLKRLYEDLVPKGMRHSLGEYLTPDWLAEHTIQRAGYEGEQRFLDPGCGSGTFLMAAIGRVRSNSDLTGQEFIDDVTSKVVGFDLNPLSVLAARANYLIGLGDAIFDIEDTTIPVYQSDSILPPTKQQSPYGKYGYSMQTVAGDFWLPEVGDRGKIEELLDLVQRCIQAKYSKEDFWEQCQSRLDIADKHESDSKELYRQILHLDEQDRDRIWTGLLRNGLAPAFEDEFDVVVGNPPWINWENISEEYREATRKLWRTYKLYSPDEDYGTSRLGGSKTDAAMLFTYVASDRYLKPDGKLAFLIPETHFKSAEAGRGFRRFQLGDGEHLQITAVDDLSDFDPFDASNRTGLIVLNKGKQTEYPVPYTEWEKKRGESVTSDLSLEEVKQLVDMRQLAASPVNDTDLTSPWLPADSSILEPIRKAIGNSPYSAMEGMNNEGLNGVYCLSILSSVGDKVDVRNLPDTGRKDIEQKSDEVDADLVYPLVQGKDVGPFSVDYRLYTFLLEDGQGNTISEEVMKRKYTDTHLFLSQFEEPLLDRASYSLNYNDDDPFYDMYGATPHTVAPYKVVWREQRSPFASAVLENQSDEYLGNKPLVPSHKLMMVPLQNEDEAHYLCALLNSSVAKLIVDGYAVDIQVGTHVVDNIDIPRYDPEIETHRELANLSKDAHADVSSESYLDEIDRLAGEIWDIADNIDILKKHADRI